MEDDFMRDLFRKYDPDLTSSKAFMARLERNLEAVELIHRENEAVMKRNRIAVSIASAAGFFIGIVFTFLYPYIYTLVQTLSHTLLKAYLPSDEIYGLHIIAWLLIGAIAVFVALNTYTIAISFQPSRYVRPED